MKEYAQDEERALPAKLFQRLVLSSHAQVLEDSVEMNKRLEAIEKRHSDEDKDAEKKDTRRWDMLLIVFSIGMSSLAIWLGLK